MKNVLQPIRTLGMWLLLAPAALAGLPLVCHPFATGDDPALPWGASQGKLSIDPRYDVDSLVDDTLRLLTPDAPVLARMENLRRATVYATRDTQAADGLLLALLTRVQKTGTGPGAALAKFDAGYLVESYRQHGMTLEMDLLGRFDKKHPGLRAATGALQGQPLVNSAYESTGNREMAYAAALLAPDEATRQKHLTAARAGTAANTPLAQNLAR